MWLRYNKPLRLFFVSFLELSSCAPAQVPAPRTPGLLLSPRSLGTSINVQQHLTVSINDAAPQEFDAALEIDSERLNLVGLALGQRVLAIDYDGQNLRSWKHEFVPPQLRAEDVLQDIQITFWPADVIAAALPSGWRIEDSDLHRTLLAGRTPVTIIEYSSRHRWSGRVELTNLRY